MIQTIEGKPGMGKTYFSAQTVAERLSVMHDMHQGRIRVRLLWELYRDVQRKARERGLDVSIVGLPSCRKEIRRQIGLVRGLQA